MDGQEIEDKGRWFKELLAGAGGAFDATLADLPSFVASKLAPEAVKRWKESKGYKVGHTVGTGTSLLAGGPLSFGAKMAKGVITDPTFRNFMGGVAQANLLGAPEWAAKKVFGEEKVADWKKKAGPAYGVGQVAGTIGSALVPVTGAKGIVSGLGMLGKGGKAALGAMKGAETAWNATKLAKASPILAKSLLAGGKAALESGAQSAARAGFGGADAGTIAKEGLKGAAIGGATAGALTGLGGVFGRQAKELVKKANQAILGSFSKLTGRDMNRALQFAAGRGAKGFGKVMNADDLLADTADLIRTQKLGTPGKLEEAVEINKKVWDQIGAAGDTVIGKRTGGEILDSLLSPDDLAELGAMGRSEDDIAAAIGEIKRSVGSARGAPNIRKGLWSAIERGRFNPPKGDALLGETMGDIATVVRDRFDDAAIDAFQAAGGKFPDSAPNMAAFKKQYRLLEPLATAEARSIVKPLRIYGGSPTAEKSLLMGLSGLGTGGVGAAGGFASGDDMQDRLRRAAIGGAVGLAGTGLSRVSSSLLGKGIAAGLPAATALSQGGSQVGEAIGKLATPLGKLAASTSQAIDTAAAEEPAGQLALDYSAPVAAARAQAEGASAGEDLLAGDTESYNQKIIGKIDSFWDEIGGESLYPGQRAAFAQAVYAATDGFAPAKTATILYPDPKQRESYLKALQVSEAIEPDTFAAAADRPNLMEGIGEMVGLGKDKKLGRTTAEQAIIGAVSKAAPEGVTPTMVKGVVSSILSGPGKPAEKRARLEAALKNYGVDFDLLREAGIV